MEPINLMTKNDCSNKMKPTITIEIEANTIGTTTSTGDMLSPESPMNKKKNPNGNLLLSALSETHPISSNRKQMHCYNTCEQQCSKHLSSIRSKPINEKEERRYYHSDDTKQESDENSENNETIDEEEEESIWPYIVENFLLILAFSCHSIFDGISIGVQADENEIWTMLIAILSHKLLIAFMLSFQIYEKCRPRVRLEAYRAEQDLIDHLNGYHHHHHHQNNQDHHHHHHHQRSENHLDQSRNESIRHAKTILWLFSTLFAAMSPIGILIVIIMNDSVSRPSESSLHIIVLASISAGTILYIVFIEIIELIRINSFLDRRD
ncbi:putative G-protein coupled receptor [Sarcoptes scabiei]|nr:putative G-protein coupled receptor [Sarcoptes scabiei]